MKANSTGYGPALMRAVENLLPEGEQLFKDPYSEKFLSPLYKFYLFLIRSPGMLNLMVKMREKASPGLIGGLICRTRYIDDVLNQAIKDGFQAVVNLGAGLDTRAFRIPGIKGIQ